MSAEYTLHIKTDDISEEDMEGWFYNCMGSKYDPMSQAFEAMTPEMREAAGEAEEFSQHPDIVAFITPYWEKSDALQAKWGHGEKWNKLYQKFGDTPQFDVGEVSFLKASLFDDQETFIPSLVGVCCEVINDGCIITDEVIDQIRAGMIDNPNTTSYSTCESDKLVEWLKKYMGKYVFSIAW